MKHSAIGIIAATVALVVGCQTPRTVRVYGGLPVRRILEAAETAFAAERFTVEERDYSAGRVSAVSPVMPGRMIGPFTWREEQWTLHLTATASTINTNHVIVTGQAEIRERGILPGSQWELRDEHPDDRDRIRQWLRRLDTAIRAAGGTFE